MSNPKRQSEKRRGWLLWRARLGLLLIAAAVHSGWPAATAESQDMSLEGAVEFIADTVTDETRDLTKPSYRVRVLNPCTLRFEEVDASFHLVPVYEVRLSDLDPRHLRVTEGTIRVETTSLRDTIKYYELPIDEGRTYRPSAEPIADSLELTDRFSFYVPRSTSHRVAHALSFAIESCGGSSGW